MADVPYYPFDSDTPIDFQNHINTIVDAVNNPAAAGSGDGGGTDITVTGTGDFIVGVTVDADGNLTAVERGSLDETVEVADATTGRVTVNNVLTRYLYRYIHFLLASDASGTPITDLSTYAGAQIFIGAFNSASETAPTNPAYVFAPFAWTAGDSVYYQTAGEGRIIFGVGATVPANNAEITTLTGTIDTAVATGEAVLPDDLQSDNFVTGTSGFTQSLRTGVAEFDQVTIQGSSRVESQTIGGTSLVKNIETFRDNLITDFDTVTSHHFITLETVQAGAVSFTDLANFDLVSLADFTTAGNFTFTITIDVERTDHGGTSQATDSVTATFTNTAGTISLDMGDGTFDQDNFLGNPRRLRWYEWGDEIDLGTAAVGDFIEGRVTIAYTTGTNTWDRGEDSTTTGRRWRNSTGVLVETMTDATARITSENQDMFALDVSGGEGLRVGPEVLFRGEWDGQYGPVGDDTAHTSFSLSATAWGATSVDSNIGTLGPILRRFFGVVPGAGETVTAQSSGTFMIFDQATDVLYYTYTVTAGTTVFTTPADAGGNYVSFATGTMSGLTRVVTTPFTTGSTNAYYVFGSNRTTSVGLTLDGDLISVHMRYYANQSDRPITFNTDGTTTVGDSVDSTATESEWTFTNDNTFAIPFTAAPAAGQFAISNQGDDDELTLTGNRAFYFGFSSETEADSFLSSLGVSGRRPNQNLDVSFRTDRGRILTVSFHIETQNGFRKFNVGTNFAVGISTADLQQSLSVYDHQTDSRFDVPPLTTGINFIYTVDDRYPVRVGLRGSFNQISQMAFVPRLTSGMAGSSPVSPVFASGNALDNRIDDLADKTGERVSISLGQITGDLGKPLGTLVYNVHYVSDTVRIPTLEILQPEGSVGITQVTRHATLM